MVDVEPGVEIADVFVMVNVNVLVCELNSHTTVAVEKFPESTPTMFTVSALAVAALNRITANSDTTTAFSFIWAMGLPCVLSELAHVYISVRQISQARMAHSAGQLIR